MADKSGAVKTYKCTTCGAMSAERGHLCAPKEAKSVYACDYCGAQGDARHMCKPKLTKLQYQCESCGRVAVDNYDLCKPKKI